MTNSREAFENKCRHLFGYDTPEFELDKYGNYYDTNVHEAYQIWQAAEKSMAERVVKIMQESAGCMEFAINEVKQLTNTGE